MGIAFPRDRKLPPARITAQLRAHTDQPNKTLTYTDTEMSVHSHSPANYRLCSAYKKPSSLAKYTVPSLPSVGVDIT